MNVISISFDRQVFSEEGTSLRRIGAYAELFDSFHFIVYTARAHGLHDIQIGEHAGIHPTHSRNRWFYVLDAIRIGRRFSEIDIVSAQDPFETGLAAYVLSKIHGAKLRLELHTDPFSPWFAEESALNRIRLRLAKFLLRRADCVRLVSPHLRDAIASAGITLRSEPVILPVFVDIEAFSQTAPSFTLHERYPAYNFIALMVSSLAPVKNVETALDAFAVLVRKYLRAGLVIAGDGPERARLQAYAEKLGIAGHVVFAGQQSQQDLISFYKTADAFLCTSRYEGYGRVLLEAAAAGKPIVSTNVGLAGTFLKDNEHILVCPIGDAACVGEKLGQLVEDNRLRSVLGISAHDRVLRESPKDFESYLTEMRASFASCLKENSTEK